ncbi:NAC domain-containing protein 2-like [Vitis vinifera]|uniref:NAC domain-containing protein 2-like n=1 Tax=Vitis vinifera TaxID=29760 RepID=UPI0008FFCE54|nr:NAC domain-containing protein 2-like [Vitis vinifera]|eukprot:XP_010654315.2 PREDICTED: NAC domain-containing protein 19-like [Vitis vinifera]
MEGNGDNNSQGRLPDRLQPFPANEDGLNYEQILLYSSFLDLPDLSEEAWMENDQFQVEQRRQPVQQGVKEIEEEQVAWADEYFRSCPPGYRFLPTDEQLIKDYLLRKVNNEPLPINRIRTVVLYDYRPDVLVENNHNRNAHREKQWYFFTLRERKHPNGTRPSRSVAHGLDGYWKATSVDKAIISDGQVIGFRKALDFYDGNQSSGIKTKWKMHEYRLNQKSLPPNNSNGSDPTKLDDWVLCKVYMKGGSNKSNGS